MRIISLFFLFVFFCGTSFAQKDSAKISTPYYVAENAVYAEAGGNAFYYSVNYVRYHQPNKMIQSLRIGFSYYPGAKNSYKEQVYFVPLEGSLLFGKRGHYFEVGLGLTFFSRMIQHHQSPGGQSMGLTDTYERGAGLNPTARIGYCYLPSRSGRLMIRAGFTPIYFSKSYYYQSEYPYENPVVLLWGGVGIGYAF